MEADVQPIIKPAICEGCLSADRKLSPLLKDESQRFFDEILDPLDNIHLPLMLCWECFALTNRFVKFKHQIRNAHNLLIKFKAQQVNKLPTLTALSTKTNSDIVFFESQLQYTKCKEDLCDIDNHELNINHKGSDEISINKELENLKSNYLDFSDKEEVLEKVNKTENISIELLKPSNDTQDIIIPLANKERIGHLSDCLIEDSKKNLDDILAKNSVKITKNSEENEKLNFKTEIDELDNNDDQFNEEIGFVEEMDPDIQKVLISQEVKHQDLPIISTNRIKKKRKKKNHVQNHDFDDSDDEPLKFKKRKKEGEVEKEPEERRKKQSNETNTKTRKCRREKAPGVVHNARVERKLKELNVAPGRLEMVVLSWEQVEEERAKALMSETFNRQEYKCVDCVIGFNHSAKLQNHMKKHHHSAGDMICEICKVRCRDRHSLSAHKRRHRVRWRCCICQAMSSRASVSADHLAREHPQHTETTHTHKCVVCDHTEPTLGKLRHHMKSHAERQKCELCGKTLRDKTSLRTHLFIHKGEKEYACPQCDKKFLFKKAMEVHMVTHNDSEHLYCYECDMNFKNHMSYYQHMKYNLKHIDPAKLKYACQLCDKKFAKAARLEEHNMAVHLKVTPIQCTVDGCSFWCSSRPVLRTHVRMIHRNMRARRNHVCHKCGNAYTTKKTLECHLRSHSGSGARPAKFQQDSHHQISTDNNCE